MRSGLPLLPTVMVVIAVPVLMGFGFWQLHRMQWKEALLADLARNSAAPMLLIENGAIPDSAQFRKVRMMLVCESQQPVQRSGRNRAGTNGYGHLATCRAGQTEVVLDAGWAARPESTPFDKLAGPIDGTLFLGGDGRWILVTDRPSPGLEPSAPPSLDTISNNHLSYAIQWFGFAAILSVIYALFVRRWRYGAVAPAPGEA